MKPVLSLTSGSTRKQPLRLLFLGAVALTLSACGETATHNSGKGAANPAVTDLAAAEREGARIIEQSRALDKSRDSVERLQVKIVDEGGQSRDFEMRLSKRRDADGRLLMLSEFLSPPEERDRNALLTAEPTGDIEGTRYLQSNDSFATVKGAVNEDSLFGLTVQEMVDGQPEKYDFRLAGEEAVNAAPVYRLEGTLKKGMDSKFPRLVTLISKETYAVLGAEFYDNRNELARRVTVTDVRQIDGRWTRMRWTIDNLAKRKKLEFDVKEVKYDQNLSPAVFTRENLKKTAFKPL